VVGLFLAQREKEEPMTIVGDGLQRRDFTHVMDVVNANFLAAFSDNQEALGGVFNVGTGTNYSVLKLAKMIGGEYVHIPSRSGEARHTLADNSKIKQVLGWDPQYCFEDYIKEQVNDFNKRNSR
jgi:UDP-glucose 4-epimerase